MVPACNTMQTKLVPGNSWIEREESNQQPSLAATIFFYNVVSYRKLKYKISCKVYDWCTTLGTNKQHYMHEWTHKFRNTRNVGPFDEL